jgi:gliding motility-associated-like protein
VAFLVTAAGISTPVVSAVGTSHPLNAHIGPIKFSHDGKKVVCSASFRNICEMFDFDTNTGKVSNPQDLLHLFPGQTFIYGIEFSPNNQLLYLTSFFVECVLYQLELSTHSIDTLNLIAGNYEFGALTMGPDKRIYMARNQSSAIDVIDKPDLLFPGCNYIEKGQPLLATTFSNSGLPNLAPYSFFPPHLPDVSLGQDTILCEGDTLVLHPSNTLNCSAQYQWPDGSVGNQFAVTQNGSYWVEANTACSQYRDTIDVKFITCTGNCVDTLFANVDKTICEGQSYEGYTESGVYQDHFISRNGCDSVRVLTLIVVAPIDLVMPDTIMCSRQKIIVKSPLFGMIYQWSTGSTAPNVVIDHPGPYWLHVHNSCSADLDTFHVSEIAAPDILVADTIFCEGETLTITLNDVYGKLLWSDGTSNSSMEIEKEGIYWVELSNECFKFKDYFDAHEIARPEVLVEDIELCEGETLTLNLFQAGASYTWSDQTQRPTININSPGDYSVVVSNFCGQDTADFNVVVVDCQFYIKVPNVFTPNADGINDIVLPSIYGRIASYVFRIFDRWGNCVFSSKDMTEPWDGYFNEELCQPGVYTYLLDCVTVINQRKVVTGDITLIR